MRKLLNALFIIASVFLTVPAYADFTGYNNGVQLGRAENLNLANGLSAAISGQKVTASLIGVANGGASLSTGSLPITNFSITLNVNNKVGDVMALPNGLPGQIINFTVRYRTGSDTEVITPATSTGWTVATLGAVGSYLTVEYIDNTTGWVVIGYSATAAS